jgi:hypothetical protein
MRVSFFKQIFDTSPAHTKDVSFYLDRIKNGASQKLVEQIRVEPDKEKRHSLKKELPVVCFGGQFINRSKKGLKKASGLMILDFDDLEDAVAYKNQLQDDKQIFAAWISPSFGLKALIRIPEVSTDEEYKFIFEQVASQYQGLDPSGKDISRACYESYDPKIYINLEAEVFKPEYKLEIKESDFPTFQVTNIPVTDQDKIANKLLLWFKKVYDPQTRNNSLYKLAAAFNDFGVNKLTAQTYLYQYEQPDFDKKEIDLLINSAYKNTSSFGTKNFEDKKRQKALTNYVLQGRKLHEIKQEFSDINEKNLEAEIEIIKQNTDLEIFWEYNEDGKVVILPYRFKLYLQSINILKYYPIGQENVFFFITKNDNFIDHISEFKIKDIVLNNVLRRSQIDVFDKLAERTKVFTNQYLSIVETANVDIEKDGKDYAMIYFKNLILKVYSDKIEKIKYEDIDTFVWENQVIKKDYVESDHHESMFRTFLWLISGKEVERYNTMKSVIGYMLHSHKTSANNKAIILNDETISDNPNGGSGKGILINAISQMKKVSTIDGKTFDFNKSFPYQTVSTDCQVLAFDDVKRNFEFERLFSLITEGITIEYKNKGAIKLPVSESPKILISTNYTIKTEGGSFLRRIFEVELSSYFGHHYTPIDEFGCMLFEDWNDEEWQRFYQFMINCIQYYLQNGLVYTKPKNLERRKFINDTCQEFIDFVEQEKKIEERQRIDRKKLYFEFFEENKEMKYLTPRLFNKWIKIYAEYLKKPYSETVYNGVRYAYIGEVEKEEELELDF